jgi:hypothetical protein
MRLQIAAVSGFRQLHTVGLQAQALQNMLSLLFQFEHGGPRESLPWPSHVLSVLSVVYTTKNRGNTSLIKIPRQISERPQAVFPYGPLMLQRVRQLLADAVEKGKNELTKFLTCAPVETIIS